MIRAPIETSLSVKNSRFSNIFSNTRIVPRACVATAIAIDVRSAGNAGHGPSSIFGIAPPRSSRTASSWPGGTRTKPPPSSSCTPSRSKAGTIGHRSSWTIASIVMSPPVTAAMPMKLPTSMWSGPIVCSPPPSRDTPVIRRTFEPMPSISAPSETRKRQRSWTCGSQAALEIMVRPGASVAAMIAFSVPITDASSRCTCAPRSEPASS